MKADGIALALQHCAFEIVVQQNTRTSVPGREGADVTAQETLHACIEEEAQENLARIAQHHDEGHQGTACAADHEMTKMPQSTCACSPNRKHPLIERTAPKLREFGAVSRFCFALWACGILGDGLVRGGSHVYSNTDR